MLGPGVFRTNNFSGHDAFLIRPISAVFKNDFDMVLLIVILLVRCQSMKVSFLQTLEFVMQLSNFDSYVASYLAAEESKEIAKYIRIFAGGEEDS